MPEVDIQMECEYRIYERRLISEISQIYTILIRSTVLSRIDIYYSPAYRLPPSTKLHSTYP